MSVSRWLLLIGVLTALGMAKVAQQTSVWRQAYQLGRQTVAFHRLENQTQWLNRDVIGLHSPVFLAKGREGKSVQLVAWSEVSSEAPVIRLSQLIQAGGNSTPRR